MFIMISMFLKFQQWRYRVWWADKTRLLQHWNWYVTCNWLFFMHSCTGGDQMTAACIRGCKRIVKNSFNDIEKLEGITALLEDWHASTSHEMVMNLPVHKNYIISSTGCGEQVHTTFLPWKGTFTWVCTWTAVIGDVLSGVYRLNTWKWWQQNKALLEIWNGFIPSNSSQKLCYRGIYSISTGKIPSKPGKAITTEVGKNNQHAWKSRKKYSMRFVYGVPI